MAPTRKAAKAQSMSGSDDEEYRKKRDRNNQAVERSRIKSQQRVEEANRLVNERTVQNAVLEARIGELKKERENLKELFWLQVKAKNEEKLKGVDLKKLLSDDYDGPDGASSTSKKK